MKIKKKKKNKVSLSAIKNIFINAGRLWKLLWKDRKGIILATLFVTFLVSIIPFLSNGVRGILINELVNIAGLKVINNYLVLILGAFVFLGLFISFTRSVQKYLFMTFWFILEEKFEFMILKKKGQIDVAVHEDPKKNDLFNKINESGTHRIRTFIDRQFFILQGIAEAGIASVILVTFNWWVFLVILIGTLPEFFVEIKYGKRVWSIHSSNAEIRRKFWNFRGYFSNVAKVTELKLFQNTKYFLNEIKKLFTSFLNKQKENEKEKFYHSSVASALSEMTIAFAVLYFVFQVVYSDLQIGTLTFIIASIWSLRSAFSGLFISFGKQYQDSLFVTDVFDFLDIEQVVEEPEKSLKLKKGQTPGIVFDNISFAYPGTSRMILKNLSLKIKPGEKVAIIGVNGAGKTTLIKLLCRFYDTTKGEILIGRHNIKDIDLKSWYRKIGAIFQDYSNYHFLVKDSIAIGRTGEKTDLQKVKDAAKASEADIFIEEWEDQYSQMLGKQFKGGLEPSIGQWQKLALARTFYRDPRVLILDEPTSSIDAEAEAKIFKKLEELPKDRTVILISHRFSTVRHADKIAVIEKGTIKEYGSHEELIKLNKTYAKLFKLQAKGYK